MNVLKSKYFFDSSINILKSKWLPFVLGIPLFFCLHHYVGILGDARLYLLQAMYNWQPERFINDLPFMFGNQDAYGIFTFFYGFVIKNFPIASGTLYFTLLGQLLWFFAALYFSYQFAKRFGMRLWATPLSFFFILYSGNNMPNDHIYFFQFIENFNCSRLFSISFGIWGLGLLFAEKKIPSLLLILIGTLIHPLSAGWCIPLWLFYYYPKTRKPIVFLSTILPLTYLLHTGPFDIYPTDWGNSTQNHDIKYPYLWREALAILYFGLFIPRYIKNERFLKFSNALLWVMIIGFYWTAVGGLGKHILIYQVQTWRVEWLFFVTAFPSFAYIIYNQISEFRHNKIKSITSKQIALLFMGYAIFMPSTCCAAIAIIIGLLIKPQKTITINTAFFILSFLCIISAGLQEITKMYFQGLFELDWISYSDLFKESGHALFLQFLWILCIIALLIKKNFQPGLQKKKYTLNIAYIAILILYCIFPQHQTLPIILTCSILLMENKLGLKLFLPILFLCVWDSVCNTDLRENNILFSFPKRIFDSAKFAIPIIICCSLLYLKTSNLVKNAVIICCSLLLLLFAIDSYDQRDAILKKQELMLDTFKQKMIFSQIKDRGKIFYYTMGNYVHVPRLQFLSGSYFCETSQIGEPLFEKQFIEGRKRDNYIFFKEQRNYIASRGEYQRFTRKHLAYKDTLLDRVTFLCSINEITHFVSNLRLSELAIQDSYKINDNETIYLYGCTHAQN